MGDIPEILPGSFYRSTIDVTVGTIVPSVIETIFDMIQKSLTDNEFFTPLGISKKSNENLLRFFRIILEPPVLISSVLLVESAFVNDVSSVGLFLPVIVQYNVERYFTQLGLIKEEFIKWVESMETEKPAISQL